jgi:hypothetical protein
MLLFCWRASAWVIVCIPVACPEIQILVSVRVCIGLYIGIFGCCLHVFSYSVCRVLVSARGAVWDMY